MSEAARLKSDTPDLDQLKDEIDALRKNIASISRHMGNGAASKVAEEGRHLYGRLADGSERVVRAASHEIEERPLTSVPVAFAIGFVGGRMLSR